VPPDNPQEYTSLVQRPVSEWTLSDVMKVIRETIQSLTFLMLDSIVISDVFVTGTAFIQGKLRFREIQKTVGPAGNAASLPSAPEGYIKVQGPNQEPIVIPYYKAS
jgi:hypothetical protein